MPVAQSIPGAYASTHNYGVNNDLEAEPEQVYISSTRVFASLPPVCSQPQSHQRFRRKSPVPPISDTLHSHLRVSSGQTISVLSPSVLQGKGKLASISTDWNEAVPEASLFCLRLGAPKSGHLEARSLGILGKVPWNHTHSHVARSKSLFAITGKRYKRNIIAPAQLPSEAKSVQRRSAAPIAGSNLGKESKFRRGRSSSGQTGAATNAQRRRAAPGRRHTAGSTGKPGKVPTFPGRSQ